MDAHFKLLLATPHGFSQKTSRWLHHMGACYKLSLYNRVLTSNFCWLPHMGTLFRLLLATSHWYSEQKTPTGYPAWVPAMNSHWMTLHVCSLQTYTGYSACMQVSKLHSATPHGCPLLTDSAWVLPSNLHWLPHMGALIKTFSGYRAWALLLSFLCWLPHKDACYNSPWLTLYECSLHTYTRYPTWAPLQTCTDYQPWVHATNSGLPLHIGSLQTHAGYLVWDSFPVHWPLLLNGCLLSNHTGSPVCARLPWLPCMGAHSSAKSELIRLGTIHKLTPAT